MKLLKNTLVFLIAAVLLVGLVPPAAAAEDENGDGASILTSLGHIDTDTVKVSSDTSQLIQLTVLNRYAGTTIDLSKNLTFTYDTKNYKLPVLSVDVTPDHPATIGDTDTAATTVTLTVTYNKIKEDDGAPKHTTTYQVKVVRANAVAPTFSGTVAKKVLKPNTLVLAASDFPSPQIYNPNDGPAMSAISINGSNPTFGVLKKAGNPYKFGTVVDLSEISQLTFSAEATGTVSYDVTAYYTDPVKGDKVPVGNVVLTIIAYDLPSVTSAITESVPKGTIKTFTDTYFTSHSDLKGLPLVSVEITPTNTTYGTWTLGTTSFTTAKTIAAANLSTVTFTAKAPGTATFKWRVSNDAGFSSYGTGSIAVTSPTLTLTSYTAGTTILKGGSFTMSPSDFDYTPTSAVMTYIKITAIPTATDGYLYMSTAIPKDDTYGYPAIAANTALTANAIIPADYLGYLCLATKTTAAHDQVTFKWSATADLKVSASTWAEAATYTVNFTTAGTHYYSTDMNKPMALASSEIASRFNSLSGYQLSYVTFTLPDKNAGLLYLNYDVTTKKGTAVTASTKYYAGKNPNLANITFVPATDYTGTATIKYSAYAENGVLLSGTISISIQNAPGGTINLQTDKNAALQFDANSFESSFLAATGKNLSYAVFTIPSSTYGVLYYNYSNVGNTGTAVSSGTIYSLYNSPYLSMVTFVPAHDYTGTVPIYFTGYTQYNEAYTCKLVITVVDSPAGIVTYTVNENGYAALSGNNFSDEFVKVSGSILSYVTFTAPPATSGTMYYQYDTEKKKGTAVSAATKYCDGRTPDISDITFVPAKDFVGTVVVSYKAYNAAGTAFTGKLKFVVSESSQLINYAVDADETVTFNSSNFYSAFYILSGGKDLSYVTFDLPSPSYGRLYYNYSSSTRYDSAVSSTTKYSVNSEPYLSYVTFVPASGYSGSFNINYTGFTSSGTSCSGKIRITVNPGATGAVTYTTTALSPVNFSGIDFSNAYTAGGTLQYVTFTLPSSSYGTLYYNYSTDTNPGTLVMSSTAYYVNSYPSISSITFVPNSSYSGTLAIGYTAYNNFGAYTSGTVLITIKSSDVETVTYATTFNKPVQFNSDDFNSAFLGKTGSSLHYVIFSLPSSDQGALYLGYTSPSSYTSSVSKGVRYYRTYSPLISDISFVPSPGYVGNVTIPYTGYTVGGVAYTGKVVINVGSSVPFSDMKTGYDWAAAAVSYLYTNGVVQGSDDGKYHPSNNMSRGDFILMVTRAFNLTGSSADNFSDVPDSIYYYDAIAAAKYYGIVSGSDGKFNPSAYITRQDAMVIISRTLEAVGIPIAEGSQDDLTAFDDATEISDYAVSATASLVKAGIITGSGGLLKPKDMITRAEMALILYKVLAL